MNHINQEEVGFFLLLKKKTKTKKPPSNYLILRLQHSPPLMSSLLMDPNGDPGWDGTSGAKSVCALHAAHRGAALQGAPKRWRK